MPVVLELPQAEAPMARIAAASVMESRLVIRAGKGSGRSSQRTEELTKGG
jgi:hypothetical protein